MEAQHVGTDHMAKAQIAKPAKPFAGSKIAEYLDKQIAIAQSMGTTQREIAAAIGYDKPNMVSMFKRGEAKVPLDKIPSLARVLNVDPGFLFRLALEQYWQGASDVIVQIFGTTVSKNERAILDFIREVSKDGDPELTTDLKRAIKGSLTGK